jgi:UDP-glucose 4-epimerase
MPTSSDSRAILVVGGAGFIGSHMVLALSQAGYQPVVLDNFCKGHADAVINAEILHGNMGDKHFLRSVFAQHRFSAVMHFGSFIEVGESIQFPARYYQNNVAATLNLLDAMLAHKVKQFVFSSSAAVYGEPQYTPIDEKHTLSPINPYGRSKQIVETILSDYAKSDGLQFATLRYFNAAGADPSGRVGERHEPESHLIPLILQVANGKRDAITIYGNDYPTPDGTCVRDYVHVADLCDAHLLALSALQAGKTNLIYNLGNGQGYSVQQVIDAAKRVTGENISVVMGKRREGDPAILVADAQLAKKELGWQPKFAELDTIVKHAWEFMAKTFSTITE